MSHIHLLCPRVGRLGIVRDMNGMIIPHTASLPWQRLKTQSRLLLKTVMGDPIPCRTSVKTPAGSIETYCEGLDLSSQNPWTDPELQNMVVFGDGVWRSQTQPPKLRSPIAVAETPPPYLVVARKLMKVAVHLSERKHGDRDMEEESRHWIT